MPKRAAVKRAQVPLPSEDERGRLRAPLLAWFDRHRRDLPWRRERTPYRVWLSEIMLQQTQVATVIPYFERFVARFPNVEALAAASLDDVLSLWRGLGYYSRARNLKAAAERLARDGFPDTAAGLKQLPGFGRYTAAAVASLAFGERVAVLDGNVARVLSRLFAIEGPSGARENEETLWALAEALVDPHRPGAFNEAMMELGALLCTPRNPGCLVCPLASRCEAKRLGRQEEIPAPKVKAARKRLELACAFVETKEGVLLGRRDGPGLFGGLWELPCAEISSIEEAPPALKKLGLSPVEDAPVATVRRTLTHRDLVLHIFRCRAGKRPVKGYASQQVVDAEEAAALGMSTAMVKALAAAMKQS